MDINNRLDAYNLQNNCKRIVVDFMNQDNNKGLNLVYMWKWEVSFFRMLDCLFARSQLNIEKKEKKKEREQDETVVTTTVASCSPFYCSIWLI